MVVVDIVDDEVCFVFVDDVVVVVVLYLPIVAEKLSMSMLLLHSADMSPPRLVLYSELTRAVDVDADLGALEARDVDVEAACVDVVAFDAALVAVVEADAGLVRVGLLASKKTCAAEYHQAPSKTLCRPLAR